MKQHAIREFKLWTICLAAGLTILATEVAVKARRPSGETTQIPFTDHHRQENPAHEASEYQPEELVARLLVESVVQIESGGKPRMVGGMGERGLMQIREPTWKETTRRLYGRALPFDRAFDPEVNRQVGTAYLAHLHQFLQNHRDQWQADERSLLLACYNAGPRRVADSGFNLRRLPASTRDYVERASALHDLYLTEQSMKLEAGERRGAMQIVQLRPQVNS